MPIRRKLNDAEIREYEASHKRAERIADAMVKACVDNSNPDGHIDTAAVQYALTLVSGFALRQVMDCIPEDDVERDELVAEFLNDIRQVAYGTGKPRLSVHSVRE